jgi:hypothetical protein
VVWLLPARIPSTRSGTIDGLTFEIATSIVSPPGTEFPPIPDSAA